MYWRSQSYDVVKYPERRREELIDWNYRSEIFAFSRRLQENLSEETLRCIFTHDSYLNQMKIKHQQLELPETNLESNAKLINRGYQLLDTCLKPYLRYTFKLMPEEGIGSITSYLKSTTVLADIAKWIGCNDLILSAEWPPSQETMANTLIALLAGIENDLGQDRVQRFVVDIILTYLNDKEVLDDIWIIPNPRETLNMILQNSKLPCYEPRIMFQTGVKTLEPCHVVGLYVDQKLLSSSAGETLSIAEDCAALESLRKLFDLTESRQPYVYGDKSEKIDYKSHAREHQSIKSYKIDQI